MKTSDFYYDLPQDLIAQTPMNPRDHSRLLVYDRADQSIRHLHFYDLPSLLHAGDALVLNETKVIPARLLGVKESSGIPVEILLLKRNNQTDWEALVRPGRRLLPGAFCAFGNGVLRAEILSTLDQGLRMVRFHYQGVFEALLHELGQMPLPPYIQTQLEDNDQYQTVYAKQDGSSAAPTAGLHFTPQLLDTIRGMGVDIVPILLHVGLGTFRPVAVENIEEHEMHCEYFEVSEDAANRIDAAHASGCRRVCVGTTSVRTLESAADGSGSVRPTRGETNIFITPGYTFRAVDALITNFHLPESTLLMLVSALDGQRRGDAHLSHRRGRAVSFFFVRGRDDDPLIPYFSSIFPADAFLPILFSVPSSRRPMFVRCRTTPNNSSTAANAIANHCSQRNAHAKTKYTKSIVRLPRLMYFVVKTTAMQTAMAIPPKSGSTNSTTAVEAAIPLPPLKEKKHGQLCPMIAAKPPTMTPSRSIPNVAPGSRRLPTQQARTAFRELPRNVSAPFRRPSTRSTLLAPVFLLPASRISTPARREIRMPVEMQPSR